MAVKNIYRQYFSKTFDRFRRELLLALGKKHGTRFPIKCGTAVLRPKLAGRPKNWPFPSPALTNWACHRCILAPRSTAPYHFPQQTLWQIGPNESSRATKRGHGGPTYIEKLTQRSPEPSGLFLSRRLIQTVKVKVFFSLQQFNTLSIPYIGYTYIAIHIVDAEKELTIST